MEISNNVINNIDNNVFSGHLNIIQFLLSKPVQYTIDNAGNKEQITDDYAIRYASANGHLNVIKFLVSLGANVGSHTDAAGDNHYQ